MADWSQLPKELVQLISEKLDNEFYLLRFRSVCSSWRSSIPNNRLPLNLPQFPNSNNTVGSIIRELSKHSFFLIKPPITPNQQTLQRPWLIRMGESFDGKFYLWHPFFRHQLIPSFGYVLNLNQISVYSLGHVFYILDRLLPNEWSDVYSEKVVVAAACHGEQPLDIVTHDNSGETMVFRCGDDSWTKIPNVAKSHQDICIFKGRPCVVDKTGRTVMIGWDLSVHLLAEPLNGGDVKYLVESECELLLVDRYISNGDDGVRIDLFRLDEKEKKWVKLVNLGDRFLFLGEGCSFSASASDLGFDNGNFVIYCKQNVWKCEMSVFHLEQGRLSRLSDYPDYFKLFWPPPEWIERLRLK